MRENLNQTKEKIEEIQKARQLIGLPRLISATKNCLMCDNPFTTHDSKSQHLCDYCRMDHNIEREIE